MSTSLTDLAVGRTNVFHLPIDAVVVEKDFNIRVHLGDLQSLANGIRIHGYAKNFIGHKSRDGQFVLTDGHRNRAAADIALADIRREQAKAKEAGDRERLTELREELDRVSAAPCQPEPRGKTDLERNLDLLIRNNGLPLSMFEEALLLVRLQKEFALSEKEVRRKTGWSKTHLANLGILLNDCSDEVIAAVRAGKISATLAVELARKEPDKVRQTSTLNEALQTAAKAGRQQATAKHLSQPDREKVAPSRAKKKTGRGGEEETGSNQKSVASQKGGGIAVKEAPLVVGSVEKTALKLTPECRLKASVLTAPVTQDGLIKGWSHGLEFQAEKSTKLDGLLQPRASNGTSATQETAFLAGLESLLDSLQAEQRLDKASKRPKADWFAAHAEVSFLLSEKEKAARVNTDTAGESVVPAETGSPVAHIIALRDRLKGDKRSKDSHNSDRFKTLNFIADYLGGGRYRPDEFEKWFTEFFMGKDR